MLLLKQNRLSKGIIINMNKFEQAYNKIINKINNKIIIENTNKYNIDWSANFNITRNGESITYSELVPPDQEKILNDIYLSSYSGTFVGIDGDDIEWDVDFYITANGEYTELVYLTNSTQQKILHNIENDVYSGTFLGNLQE